MAEEKVIIESGVLKLEGLLADLPGDKGLVMTHPHSLYGGSMHNPVVEAVVRAYQDRGYATLRFNFRGVDGSQGNFGDGIGEQEDVIAALDTLLDLGKTQIDLGGYSFGAWVCARGLERLPAVRRFLMVSPPVSAMDMDDLGGMNQLGLVIAGSVDDIGEVSHIRKLMPGWNPEAALEVIDGADHFYGGQTGEIEAIVRGFLDKG